MVVCWPVPHTEYSCIEYYLHATIHSCFACRGSRCDVHKHGGDCSPRLLGYVQILLGSHGGIPLVENLWGMRTSPDGKLQDRYPWGRGPGLSKPRCYRS
jgi:hypothetical protein